MSGSCSLLVLRINFLGFQVRLCTAFSVISAGGCIRLCLCERKKRQRKEQFGDVIARNGTGQQLFEEILHFLDPSEFEDRT
jgi:hypothetical protein